MTDADLRDPSLTRLFHGTYVASSVPASVALLAAGALALSPAGSIIAGHTAAQLWGGVVPHRPDVTVRIPPSERVEVRGIRALRRQAVPSRMRFGIPVTTPEQTFIDLAASLSVVDLVVLGDSLVRRGRTTPADLVAQAKTARTPGIDRARRAAGLVRAGVDSAPESRVRMLLVLAGLPEPVVNHIVRTDAGDWLRRHELAYVPWKVAIEYDGRHHAPGAGPLTEEQSGEAQWIKDLRRREDLENDGWRIVVLVHSDLARTPEATLARICHVLADRGAHVRVRRQEWRRFFPMGSSNSTR